MPLLRRGWLHKDVPYHVSANPSDVDQVLTERLTAIRIKDLGVQEQTTGACEEEDTRSHIRIMTRTARRIGHGHVKLGLLVVSRRTGRHLAGEDARCDAVDADLGFGKGTGHHSCEVNEAWDRMSVCMEEPHVYSSRRRTSFGRSIGELPVA